MAFAILFAFCGGVVRPERVDRQLDAAPAGLNGARIGARAARAWVNLAAKSIVGAGSATYKAK
jgi:hypothetical protein